MASGQTSKKVLKGAASFLALEEAERVQWVEAKANWKTIASWAASLLSQAPDRAELMAEARRKSKERGGEL